MAYGRALLSAGEVVESLESAFEKRRAALELTDIALQANACAILVDALGHAARCRQAPLAAEEGLARFPRSIPYEEWLIGFNPLIDAKALLDAPAG